jgi:hypothetical protein
VKAIKSGKLKTKSEYYYSNYDMPLSEIIVSKKEYEKDSKHYLQLCNKYADGFRFELKTRKMGKNICISRIEQMLSCGITKNQLVVH